MRISTSFSFLFALAVAGLLCTGCAKDPYLGMTPDERIVAEASAAIGGKVAYTYSRVLKFDFVERQSGVESARRNHDWDRKTHAYSIQWRDQVKGQTYKVQFPTKGADGWRRGTALTIGGRVIRNEDELQAICKQAHEYFIHDMHWLLAPYRLSSRRVETTNMGRVVDARGAVTEKIKAVFEDGSAPQQVYHIYIDPNSKKWETWGIPVDDEFELSYTWEGWKRPSNFAGEPGPAVFSTRRRQIDGDHEILIEKLMVDPGR